jgi:hypothetical protein
MARTVFFSFYYDKDMTRMWNVRKSGQFKRVAGSEDNAKLFMARDRWEDVKRQGPSAITRWIDEGLRGSGVTVVLIGEDTWQRKYVRYEIEESERQNKGMLGIYVHNLKDWYGNYGVMGSNPFHYADIDKTYRTYDWINDRGYDNFSDWVEQAALDAGR